MNPNLEIILTFLIVLFKDLLIYKVERRVPIIAVKLSVKYTNINRNKDIIFTQGELQLLLVQVALL